MTLTDTALEILAASKAASLEDAEPHLRRLHDMIAEGVKPEEIPSVLSILADARTAMYSQRTQMMLSLKELENSSSYTCGATCGAESRAASWEMAG